MNSFILYIFYLHPKSITLKVKTIIYHLFLSPLRSSSLQRLHRRQLTSPSSLRPYLKLLTHPIFESPKHFMDPKPLNY